MKKIDELPRIPLGLYPTPLYRLENISARYGRDIWIKRDDLCGVALGGNKVRKLEFLLADARDKGCDTVFTTGGAQSNHAMLTAACAARLGMKCILLLKKRGVTEHKGNIVLDGIFGAELRFIDTDDYKDIYDEMHRTGAELAREGHKSYYIEVGGSNPLGSMGYVRSVRELAEQAGKIGLNVDNIVSPTGSGGTTAGLLLGARLFCPGAKVTGVEVDSDPFDKIVPELARGAAGILGKPLEYEYGRDFELFPHIGAGYAIPNKADTPYIEELARTEGILLDPVYTGKAWTGMLMALKEGYFPEGENVVFFHTGGAPALFAMDLPEK